MAGPSVAPSQVLDQLMDNGLFDTLRKSITAELESNMELKRFTTEAVERSAVLQAPGAERKNRRELFESLRKELQMRVLERASEAAWRAILSKQGVGLQIEEQVERTWWELNGWGEPPERARPAEKKPAAVVPNESQNQASTPPSTAVPATDQVAEPQHGSGTKDETWVSKEETAQLAGPEADPDKQQAADVLYTPLVSEVKEGEAAPAVGTQEDGSQAAEGTQLAASTAEPIKSPAAEALSPIYTEVPVKAPEGVHVSSQDRVGNDHMPGPSPADLQKSEMPIKAPGKEAQSQQDTVGDLKNGSSQIPKPVEPQKSETPIEASGNETQSQQDTVRDIKNELSHLPEAGSISGEGPAEGRSDFGKGLSQIPEPASMSLKGPAEGISERPQEAAARDDEGGEAAKVVEQSAEASVRAAEGGLPDNRTAAAEESTGLASAQEGLPAVDVPSRGPDEMDIDMVEAGTLETAADVRETAAGPTSAEHPLQREFEHCEGGEGSGHPWQDETGKSEGGERSGEEDQKVRKDPLVGEDGGKDNVPLGETGAKGVAVSNEGGEEPQILEKVPLIQTSANLVAEQSEGLQLAEKSPENG